VTAGKRIAVRLQCISGVSALNPIVAFTTSIKERERCYSFVPSQAPHETPLIVNKNVSLHRNSTENLSTLLLSKHQVLLKQELLFLLSLYEQQKTVIGVFY
jgi:hypothetical protein